MLHTWKCRVDREQRPLSPLPLGRGIQTLLEHELHQAVQVEQFGLRVTLDQRVAAQELHGLVEQQWLARDVLQMRPQ